MNAERLLALFERISEAPDAIPRLRRFILDLAVRGKLVEQDPEDEPAGELLQRLKVAKTLAYELEGLRKRQPVNSVSRGDLWFEMPADWALACLDDLFVIVSGVTKGQKIPPSKAVEVPYLRVANVQRGSLDLSQIKTISVRAADVERYRLEDQDILMTEGGDWDKLGRAAIWADQIPGCIHQNHVFRLRVPTDELMPEWVVLYANSDPGRRFFEDCSKQTTNLASINLTQLRSCPLPLPPLAEQHRIVAKVDELMALCDQLEAARQQREQCRERLAAASLQRLNQPNDDPEAFRSDARFALQVLPSLTTTPAQIKQLRQTILSLAVRGKLVEQDPEDELAINLLTELQRVRDIRVALGELKAPRKSFVVHDKSKRALSPPGWTWAFASDLWDFENGDRSKNYPSKDQFVDAGVPFVNAGHLVDGVVDMSRMNFISRERFELLSGGKLRQGDQLFCLRGSLGKHAVYLHQYDAAIASSLVILRPIIEDLVPYLKIYLDSDIALDMLRRYDNGTAQPNLSSANLKMFEVPLPPLAEQHRIVAKVDELMALCDQLEQQLSQAEESRRRLLEAVLQEALADLQADLVLEGRS